MTDVAAAANAIATAIKTRSKADITTALTPLGTRYASQISLNFLN